MKLFLGFLCDSTLHWFLNAIMVLCKHFKEEHSAEYLMLNRESYENGYTISQTDQRTYNDKAYTSPHLFGQFFNFRIFIKFFIHEVKKTSKF